MSDFIPVQHERLFHRNALYSDIDWTDLSAVISAFRTRMENWYIRPAQKLRASSGHYSFSVVALTCMLVDTLAQYRYNLAESRGQRFQQILREHDPIFQTAINPPIDYHFRSEARQITDYAMAIWVCYRCGILHESHVMLCGAISGESRIMQQRAGVTLYPDGNPCPTLVLDPRRFLISVESLFDNYIRLLRAPQAANHERRRNFAAKFERSFGVPVPNVL